MRGFLVAALVCAACGDDSAAPDAAMPDAAVPDAGPQVLSIAVNPADVTIDPNAMQPLTAMATYSDGTSGDVTSAVTWQSGSDAVARVDAAGVVTGVAAGHATIMSLLDGASGSARISVRGLALLHDTQVFASSGQTFLDDYLLEADLSGNVRLAYSSQGPSARLLSTRSWSGEMPATWPEAMVPATDYSNSSAVDEQLALGGTAQAGLVYRRTADGQNPDSTHFGVAYATGGTWTVLPPHAGGLAQANALAIATPAVAMDGQGTFYAAYVDTQSSTLAVARYDAQGLIDDTPFTDAVDPGSTVLMAANGQGHVMVFDSSAGSHVFDGNTWGALQPFSANFGPVPAALKLHDDGTADLVTLDTTVTHYHDSSSGWTTGTQLGSAAGPNAAGAAMDATGTIVAAYVPPGAANHLFVRTFDGASWSAPMQLDTDGSGSLASVTSDGVGRFLVLWNSTTGRWASLFDGSWHGPFATDQIGPAAMRPDGQVAVGNLRIDTLYVTVYQLID